MNGNRRSLNRLLVRIRNLDLDSVIPERNGRSWVRNASSLVVVSAFLVTVGVTFGVGSASIGTSGMASRKDSVKSSWFIDTKPFVLDEISFDQDPVAQPLPPLILK